MSRPFRRHGLWLDEMAEPEPAPEWAAKRADAAEFPVFLVMRCVKADGVDSAALPFV